MDDQQKNDRRPARGGRHEQRPRLPEQETPEENEESGKYTPGRRAVLELLSNSEERGGIEKIYIAFGSGGPQMERLYALAKRNRIPITELDRTRFRELERQMGGKVESQGVLALHSARSYQELEDVLGSETDVMPPLLVALDGIQDPHNIGAIIRSAEAFGANAVLLPKHGAVITPTVYKTSAGAASHLPIVKISNLAETLRKLREEYGFQCLGLAGEAEKDISEIDLTLPTCLVIGGEEKGMHRLVRERCDALVRIPISGQTSSLNASVATGVALFEVVRQRLAKT